MNKHIIIFILISLSFSIAYADLDFEFTTLKEEVSPLANEFYFYFPFENNSSESIEIKNISTSCSCILSEVEKKIYLPKEKGVLYGILDISGKTGILKQSVFVDMDSPTYSKIKLSVEVHIKPIVKIKPTLLFWNIGDNPSPQSTFIYINPDFAESISDIKIDGNNFNINLIPDPKDKFKFELSVNPQKTNEPLQRLIYFQVKATDGTLKKHFIHAVIK